MSVIVYTGGTPVLVQDVAVTVPPPAPSISNATATPATLPVGGGSVVINATIANATSVTLDGAQVTLPATVNVAATHSFALVAHGATPPDASATLPVTVAIAPPTGSVFDNLARNTVRRLGTYVNPDPDWYQKGANITDDSACAADPARHQFLLFGGSHGRSQETDIRAFNTLTGAWSTFYPSTKWVDMVAANCDSVKGLWINTGQPVARHTYSHLVVRGGRFYVMTAYCQPTYMNGPDLPYFTGKLCWYDFATKQWTFSARSQAWHMASGSVLDPVSQNLYILGIDQASWGYVWRYDPVADAITTGPKTGSSNYQPSDAVYCPDDDRFYMFENNGRVWRVAINRANFAATTAALLTTTGPRPTMARPLGYPSFTWDSVNKRMGGCFINGIHYDFNPVTLAWTATTVQLEAGSTGVCSNDFSCSAYMESIGCYVFVQIHPTLGAVTLGLSPVTVYATAGEAVALIDEAPGIPAPGALVSLGVVFGATGLLPWAYGHWFKRGDAAGSVVVANCAEFQCIPWSFHDDGSVRDAHLAGYCQVVVPGRMDVAMRLGNPVASPPFIPTTFTDMQILVNGVAPGIAKRTTIASGPVMLHERVTARVDQQIAIVWDERAFKHGEREIRVPRIHNTGFLASNQPNRPLVVKITIGGRIVFNEPVDVKHHTTPALMRGSNWSYWIGGDPTVLPVFDGAYLCAAESVPPFVVNPAAKLPVGVPQTYTPTFIGESGPSMSATGYSPRIGLLARSNIFALTLGGRAAWNYLHAEALSVGSWPIHLRDELTDAPPLPSAYPLRTWQANTADTARYIPHGSGGTVQNCNGYDLSHHPSSSYVAAKLTGWSDLLGDQLDWCMWNHFYNWDDGNHRQQAKGILRTDTGTNQDRGAAWGWRTIVQTLSLLPPAHPHFAELHAIWAANMAFYKARLASPPYANALGVIAPYSSWGTSLYTGGDRGTSVAWWGAGWMQCFLTAALGQSLQLHLPIGAQAQADTRAVFDHSAKFIVGWSQEWRRFAIYAVPFYLDGSKGTPGTWYADWAAVRSEMRAAFALPLLDPAPGGSIKKHDSNIDIAAGEWTIGFTGYAFPALVYAVMHNAPGAAAALNNIMSSVSWPSIAGAINEPEWSGMMPPGFKHPGAP